MIKESKHFTVESGFKKISPGAQTFRNFMIFDVFIGLNKASIRIQKRGLLELLSPVTVNEVGNLSSSIWKRIKVLLASLILSLYASAKCEERWSPSQSFLASSCNAPQKWKPIKTLQLAEDAFQNKNTSVQCCLGEHGPLNGLENKHA